jgi:hypothetical protein
MREEVKRIEAQVEKLSNQKQLIISIDPASDVDDVENLFQTVVLAEAQVVKEKALRPCR